MSDKHPTRRHGGSVPPSADIAPWPDERGGQQAREFDRLTREAYAWGKLFATGEKSPSDPLFMGWYARAIELESGR